MKLKQTKKKLFLTSSILVFCICLGFVIRKSFDNQTHAENTRSVDDITIIYDKNSAKPLGTPGTQGSPIKVFSPSVESRLTSWNNLYGKDEYGIDRAGTLTFSDEADSAKAWQTGYRRQDYSGTAMAAMKYVSIPSGFKDESYWGDKTYLTMTSFDGYVVKATVVETKNESNYPMPLVASIGSTMFEVRELYDCSTYNESNCTLLFKDGEGNSSRPYYTKANTGLFIKLRFEIQNSPSIVYLEVADIDGAQSFRIHKTGICNDTSSDCEIYATQKDTTGEQILKDNTLPVFDENGNPLMNNFATNGRKTLRIYDEQGVYLGEYRHPAEGGATFDNNEQNYLYTDPNTHMTSIFSSYSNTYFSSDLFYSTSESNPNNYGMWGHARVFAKLKDMQNQSNPELNSNTVDVTFGFHNNASTSWVFYTEAYDVNYEAVGETDAPMNDAIEFNNSKIYVEEQIKTVPAPKEPLKYRIAYWTTKTAINNAQLSDGTTINLSANDEITEEQIKKILVKEDYTFVAHLEFIDYTITFKNDDGSEISKKTDYHYGDAITVPANPTKPSSTSEPGYDYSFNGWSPALPDSPTVTGNATYTATYTATIQQYPITFVNWNDSVLQSTNYNYGTTPSYNGTPTRPADDTYTYNFTGWDKQVVPVTGAATYKAQYEPKFINYTITFYDEDKETILLTKSDYHYNDEIITPSPAPTKPSTAQYQYTFSGYESIGDSPELTAHSTVTRDAEYRATYVEETRKYPIKFIDDDKIIEEQEVEYGETPDAPDVPIEKVVENCTYKFAGWDPEIETVTGEATYKATYAKVSCTEVPNTGSGSEKSVVGKVVNNVLALPFVVTGTISVISIAIAARFYKRRKTMKF